MIEPDDWIPPPASPALAPDEVHLWVARLPLAEHELARCVALLAPDERERAAQTRVPEERARFVASRGLLRTLLARYTGSAAEALRFAYGPRGKPALMGAGEVRFNVSHAGDATLLAFALDREVGVDVERVREVPRAERIAARIFTAEAAGAWRALPAEARRDAFMREWTRLEALAKLSGEGVWRSVMRGESERATAGRSFELRPLAGYLGAVAVEGEGAGVRLRSWRYQEGLPSSSASSASGGSGGEK